MSESLMVSYEVEGVVAVITVNNPPVNALTPEMRGSIIDAVAHANADPAVAAIVLIGGGQNFIAGADIRRFGKARTITTRMSAAALDASAKPTVAAIHGYALGGGLEHALACHYRIALPTAKLGLPEVALGLIPGGGGTQRLPRLVGAAVATDLLVSSRHVHAAEALKIGLISQIVPGTQSQELRDAAVSYAKAVAHAQPQRVRDLVLEPMDATTMDVLQAARREAAKVSSQQGATVRDRLYRSSFQPAV
ncbi:enoyl-CoA hydratase/isomerase family protein [Pseudomonas lini]